MTADGQSPAAPRDGSHSCKHEGQTPVLKITSCSSCLTHQLLRHAAQLLWCSRWLAHDSLRLGSTSCNCTQVCLEHPHACTSTAAGLVCTPADLQDTSAGTLVCRAEGSTIASCLHRRASTACHAAIRSVMSDVQSQESETCSKRHLGAALVAPTANSSIDTGPGSRLTVALPHSRLAAM